MCYATAGRFLSRDTWAYNFQNPRELNRYSYVAGNPINSIDPTGHEGMLSNALRFAKSNPLVVAVVGFGLYFMYNRVTYYVFIHLPQSMWVSAATSKAAVPGVDVIPGLPPDSIDVPGICVGIGNCRSFAEEFSKALAKALILYQVIHDIGITIWADGGVLPLDQTLYPQYYGNEDGYLRFKGEKIADPLHTLAAYHVYVEVDMNNSEGYVWDSNFKLLPLSTIERVRSLYQLQLTGSYWRSKSKRYSAKEINLMDMSAATSQMAMYAASQSRCNDQNRLRHRNPHC